MTPSHTASDILRIATYNIHKGVQGLGPARRLEIHNLGLAVEQLDADIVCLQETKLEDANFPKAEIEAAGFHVAFSGQKTYNGVALLSKAPASDVIKNIPGFEDEQARLIAATLDVEGGPVRLVNGYFVNGQEPGSEEEIKTFCSTTYGVTFPLFSKIDVNGEHRAPLYQKLVAAAPKAVAPEGSGFYERMASKGRAPLYVDDILWNFEKFLLGKDGQVIQRFSPDMTPDDPQLVAAIKGALAK